MLSKNFGSSFQLSVFLLAVSCDGQMSPTGSVTLRMVEERGRLSALETSLRMSVLCSDIQLAFLCCRFDTPGPSRGISIITECEWLQRGTLF